MYTKLQPNNIRSDLPIIPVIDVKEEEWEGEHTGESCDGNDESKGDITDGNEWLTVEEAVLRNDATCNNINKKFMLNRNMRVYHSFSGASTKYIYGSRLFSCCLFLFVGGEKLLPLLSTGWLQNGFEHGVDNLYKL